jgi:hypothetical protein
VAGVEDDGIEAIGSGLRAPQRGQQRERTSGRRDPEPVTPQPVVPRRKVIKGEPRGPVASASRSFRVTALRTSRIVELG